MEKRSHRLDVREIAAGVAESLWAIYHRRDDAPSLILPITRDGAIRVSEQESKILLAHWLEREGLPYSIETPTEGTYRQKGESPQSARTDVTVYHSRNPSDRILNVELKQGTANDEAFRKDFEKLLRERTDGLWFHTLEHADSRTWSTMEERIRSAFRTEQKHVDAANHSLSFAFCVLTPPQFVWFELDLGGPFGSQWPQAVRDARDHPSAPAWWRPVHSTSPSPVHSSSRKGPQKLLIYCAEICEDSFVHLNIQGSSYRLRSFGGSCGVRCWVDRRAKTTEDLLSRYQFAHRINAAGERQSLDSKRQYWADRIAKLNRQYGIRPGTSSDGGPRRPRE